MDAIRVADSALLFLKLSETNRLQMAIVSPTASTTAETIMAMVPKRNDIPLRASGFPAPAGLVVLFKSKSPVMTLMPTKRHGVTR
jgi:hypothetical protein